MKTKNIRTVSGLAIVLAGFAGCSNVDVLNDNLVIENLSRKEELASFAVAGNYISTEEEMENSLKDFLSMNNLYSRTASVNNEIELMQMGSESIKAKEETDSRNIKLGDCDEVEIFLYSIKNKISGKSGYAFTSKDRRIGGVLAVVEDGSIDEASGFTELFLGLLSDYVQETSAIWNDLDSEFLNDFSETYEARSAYSSAVTSGDYSYSNWVFNSGNIDNILATNWNQGYPYNVIVEKELGSYYPTGCGPTAVAMLLANIEYPKYSALDGYKDIVYDWSQMKKSPYSTCNGKSMVAVLMYELGKGFNCSYSSSNTGCKNSAIVSYLKRNGYVFSGFSSYCLDELKDSIDLGYPVLCQGYAIKKVTKKKKFGITYKTTKSYSDGHYWVVDGYANLSCTATNKNTSEIMKIESNFVHCNVGWGGYENGYYIANVFDFNHPLATSLSRSTKESGTSYYYQYKLTMLTNLHHE